MLSQVGLKSNDPQTQGGGYGLDAGFMKHVLVTGLPAAVCMDYHRKSDHHHRGCCEGMALGAQPQSSVCGR